MNHEINTDGYVEVGIQELRVRPGTELKILDSQGKELSHKSQFVAAFASQNILISLLVDTPKKINIHVGENYQINVFTGKYDFSFTSSALQVNDAQFNALLSCPDKVSVKFVRNHLRATKLSLPATVKASEANIPVTVKDLSVSGVGLDSTQPVGNIGDRVNFILQVEFDKRKVNLNLVSIIKHATEFDNGTKLRTGVEFENVSQNDKLALYYYVSTLSETELMR